MRKKSKKLIYIFILFIVFSIYIGYSVMNRTLVINGNTAVVKNTWNLYFDNIKVTDGSINGNSSPVIDNSTFSVNFNVVLNLPGDFYEFTVDVVNSGTIDAMIDSVSKMPELSASQAKYLEYIIEYQNGEQITSKQLVAKDSFVRLKVRVEYKKDIAASDLPTVTENLNLSFVVNYLQADGTFINVKDNGVLEISANGSLDTIGTIVTIGSEKFYTIGTVGDNVKLLSMYNLYVGGDFVQPDVLYIPYGDEATGMQDENMIGLGRGITTRKGTTLFSSPEVNSHLYDDSIIKPYVDNYKIKLEKKFGIKVEEARLITYEELIDPLTLACSASDYSCSSSPYPWLYSTSYWTGSFKFSGTAPTVWGVDSFDGLCNYSDFYENSGVFGVRPVIVVSKNYFNG